MFKSNKVNHMTVIVKGVRDDDYEGRELMMEVVRRNCKMDPRLVSQTVYSIRTYEDGRAEPDEEDRGEQVRPLRRPCHPDQRLIFTSKKGGN